MVITLSNKCKFEGVSKYVIPEITKKLTLINPVFGKKMDMQLSVFGVPKFLKFYETPDERSVVVPIGAYQSVYDLLEEYNENPDKATVIDVRLDSPNDPYFSTLKFTGKLRDYQEDTKQACLKVTNGIIESMTGSGKTVIFVDIVISRKQPTLILVNTLELVNQTVESFLKFTNLKAKDIGFIGSGKFSVKPITIGLHQTMAKLDDEKYKVINSTFSQIIADEVHIVGATTYYKTMNTLKAKYKFGFSATPKREDGLTQTIHYATGPTIHTVPKEQLINVLIKPSYSVVETDYYYPLFSSSEYQYLISDLSENVQRNDVIANHWIVNNKGKSTIMLCLRLSQVFALHNKFPDNSVILHSKMKKDDRKEAMRLITSGEKEIVISTYGLFSTGIDVPRLEVLMLCAPMKSEIKLKQAAGRLMRICEGKTAAEVIDFVDKKVDLLKYQFFKRSKILKNL